MKLKYIQYMFSIIVVLGSFVTNGIAGKPLPGPVRGKANIHHKGSMIVYREKGANLRHSPVIFLNGGIVMSSLLPGEYTQTRVCSGDIKLRVATRGDVISKGKLQRFHIPRGSLTYIKIVETRNKTFAPMIVDEAQAQKTLNNLTETSNIVNRYVPQVVLGTDSLFKFNSAVLLPSSRIEIDRIIRKMKICSDQVKFIKIIGHTDRIGNKTFNEKLSKKRAQAVADYLKEKGITVPMVVEGRGSSEPVTSNCRGKRSAKLIQCLQADRRVVIEY